MWSTPSISTGEHAPHTQGSGGKPRDAYLPREVERDLPCYQRAESIAQSDPVIDV